MIFEQWALGGEKSFEATYLSGNSKALGIYFLRKVNTEIIKSVIELSWKYLQSIYLEVFFSQNKELYRPNNSTGLVLVPYKQHTDYHLRVHQSSERDKVKCISFFGFGFKFSFL